jgi:hypothetical protein
VRRFRFGHSEVATTHRGGDKPGRIRQRRLGLDDSDSTTRTRRLGLDDDDDDDDDDHETSM